MSKGWCFCSTTQKKPFRVKITALHLNNQGQCVSVEAEGLHPILDDKRQLVTVVVNSWTSAEEKEFHFHPAGGLSLSLLEISNQHEQKGQLKHDACQKYYGRAPPNRSCEFCKEVHFRVNSIISQKKKKNIGKSSGLKAAIHDN